MSEWMKQFEGKMDFFTWLANDQDDTVEWAEEFVKGMFVGRVVHVGDCTRSGCPCSLCLLESFLEEYRKYYFKGTFKDEYK